MTAEADIAAIIAGFLSDQSNNTSAVIGYAVIGDMIIGNIGTSTNYGALGTSIFIDYMPPTPDNCIGVFGYAGQPPEHMHEPGGIGKPGIQIRVRNTSAATGRALIETIFTELDGIVNQNLLGTYYLAIWANQSPEPLGKDENGRAEFVQNFTTWYRR